MPKRFVIFPYHMRNSYSKDLAEAMDTYRIRRNGLYVPRRNDVVICWGNTPQPTWDTRIPKLLNAHVSVNKLRAFQLMARAGVKVPDFETTLAGARALFTTRESKVLCRTLISAFEGRGINIAVQPQDLVPAPLYVKYIPKEHEYRFHVIGGEVIDVTQKRLRTDAPAERNKYIRNTRNGWIFSRRLDVYPDQANVEAINAVRALGLDFGAVDIIIGSQNSRAYVLEVNTAPGIEGTTVSNYVNAFRRIYG